MKVDSSKLSKLLKKVYLGGVVEEAVIDFGSNTVQAVDPTNSVFLNVSEEPSENGIGRVGIGNPTLSMLIRHLDSIKGEVTIKKVDQRLVVSSGDKSEVKYLTVDEEFVSSVVLEDNTEQLIEPAKIFIDIASEPCANFNFYMNLVKTKSAKFVFNAKKKTVHVESGLKSEHQFTIPFGKAEFVEEEIKDDFTCVVYGAHINQIFSVLDFSAKDAPQILLAPDHPVIILQDDTNMWACLPLSEDSE